MTDTEHAKQFALDSISLATSMTNPEAYGEYEELKDENSKDNTRQDLL